MPGSAVVICFHFTIFVVLETTKRKKSPWNQSCDLLSFYYLCRTRNNRRRFSSRRSPVVICFHFTIFVVLETTFAPYPSSILCCDLLSFYYLCRTRNNEGCLISQLPTVVICFHFTIFVVLETTSNMRKLCRCCCDLLSFYYLCRTRNNGLREDIIRPAVVICFHFTIFVVLETTYLYFFFCHQLLWFAFILLSLSY